MLIRSLLSRRFMHSSRLIFTTPIRQNSIRIKMKGLRVATGSPLKECKIALDKFGGDINQAKIWLREQQAPAVEEKVEPPTLYGQIGIKLINDNKTAVVLEVNCETDFLARTKIFKDGVAAYFDTLINANDLEIPLAVDEQDEFDAKKKFLSSTLEKSLDSEIQEMTGKDGITYLTKKTQENIKLGKMMRQTATERQTWGHYLHLSHGTGLCQLGSLVLLESDDPDLDLSFLAETLALHVVATRPSYISQADADASGLKYTEEEILLNQGFISPDNDENLTVEACLAQLCDEKGAEISIKDFKVFSCV
ncbi:unnamed protein product [Moneuplotes crassus]|uniref:Elongation factor Ts, mitochondrial n=1 Tax=Euplotes crassus TaxID=5936 RepID=A0AAD1XPU3_EUPCR|nr:unnamed protein product [Moneuplotes crassus]